MPEGNDGPPMSTISIKGRILASVTLSTLQFLSQIGLRLVSAVVLTRLLAPEVYGVFAVVLVYRYLLEMLSDLGLRSVILTRERVPDDRFLQTCWSVSILRGALIWGFSGLIALAIHALQVSGVFATDSVYTDPALPLAIAALGGVAFVAGFLSMNRYAVEREMRFGHVTISMVASNVVGLVVTIALAYALRSVWALVLGAAVQTLFLVVYSHAFFRGPRMRPVFDRPAFDIIFARGKWILGHSTLSAAMTAADRLLLGFVVNAATFGFYYLARQLLEIVQTFLGTIHGQMGLQVFTHILKSPDTFRKNYYRYRLFFDAPACLAVGGIFVLSPMIVDVLFDERYAGVADIVRIIIFALLFVGPLTLREAYSAERRFREMMFLSLVSTVVLWVGLTLATFVFQNFIAALWTIALYRLPEVVILWIGAARRGWLVWWREALLPVFVVVGIFLGWGADRVLVSVAVWANLL